MERQKEKAKRPRGTGSLYQVPGSSNWYIKYHLNGKPKRESTRTDNKRKAEKILQQRLNACASGTFLGPEIDRILVSEIVEDVLLRNKVNGHKSLDDDEQRWRQHLQPKLGHFRCSQITTDILNSYIAERQREPLLKSKVIKKVAKVKYPQNATINRELALLRSAFNYAMQKHPPKVTRVPYFPMLEEHNVRSGFLKDEQYMKLAEECGKVGLWLRGLFEVAASYCWRKSEAAVNLRVRQIDLRNRTIDLEPGTTKNDDARMVKMTDRIYHIVAACIEGKKADDLVFTRKGGRPPGNFRKVWIACCKRAEVPNLLFHDLRRTGARNLRRLGVAEGTIMKIGGWKTRSVFDRYNIIDSKDLSEAAVLLDEKQKQLELESKNEQEKQFGHSLGKVAVNAAPEPQSTRVN